MNTTVGKLLINEALPPDLRNYDAQWDKKTVHNLFTELAHKHPEQYSDVNWKLNQVAADAATTTGGQASLSLADLRPSAAMITARKELGARVEAVSNGGKPQEQKDAEITQLLADSVDRLAHLNYEEGLKNNSALAFQVLSGSRGNKLQLAALSSGDVIVSDHHEHPIPVPMLSGYAEGLAPAEYWAQSYGARRGYVDTKAATPEAGYLSKQINDAAHRLVVTEHDCGTDTGIPVDASDPDNEGSVLARPSGNLKAGTVLSPANLRGLKGKIVVHSPVTCTAPRGVCQLCAGIRESGAFPEIGSAVGISAAQAVTEPLTQAKIGSKHKGGLVGGGAAASASGFDAFKSLVEVPEEFPGSAAVAETDGHVEAIRPAPQGGSYVVVGGQDHWVPPGADLTHKVGDVVEAGDTLSAGLANPAAIVKHKGVGEGRFSFIGQLRTALGEAGTIVHRRNLELISRALINHVRVTDLDGPEDTVPNDVVEYDSVARNYRPRAGSVKVAPNQAFGLYLERPALHYSIGTRVTPNVAKTLAEAGVGEVEAHKETPSFQPEMVRALESLGHAADWMVRLGGYNLKKNTLEAVRRGRSSSASESTSFIPSLARGVGFGNFGRRFTAPAEGKPHELPATRTPVGLPGNLPRSPAGPGQTGLGDEAA